MCAIIFVPVFVPMIALTDAIAGVYTAVRCPHAPSLPPSIARHSTWSTDPTATCSCHPLPDTPLGPQTQQLPEAAIQHVGAHHI